MNHICSQLRDAVLVTLMTLLFLCPTYSQTDMSDPIQKIEETLNVQLPESYIQLLQNNQFETIELSYKIDLWFIWNVPTTLEMNQQLQQKQLIGEGDYAFGANEEKQVLFFRKEGDTLSEKVFIFDEELDIMFYAFSIKEMLKGEALEQLIEELETADFEQQDLSPIQDCPGCLFRYAFNLKTSEYDDNFSEKRNQRAFEMYQQLAEQGHPSAARELAYHYYFQETTDVEKAIQWWHKAIQWGIEEERYELADFILDHKPAAASMAITQLEALLDHRWMRERTLLKLGRTLMRGPTHVQDHVRGIQYIKAAAEYKNYNALSDLAFYHYKGIGVEKNLKTAHALLTEAEALMIQKTGEGMWQNFIDKIAQEMKAE